MSVKLSVLVPSIRPNNLQKLYDSIKSSFSGAFEMIVASPYELPESLNNDNGVKLITTHRPPLAAQQQALIESTGEWITWAADDGYYLPGALDESFRLLEGQNYKTVIMGKYQEGEKKDDHMEGNDYYILTNHVQSTCFFISEGTLMLNCGVLSRQILMEMGGWDAGSFHTCPPGYNDLAVRLQNYSCKFIIQTSMMFECSHLPGVLGDHAPLHFEQTLRDEPMFKEIWNHPYFSKRLAINLENYKKSPVRWERRFGK